MSEEKLAIGLLGAGTISQFAHLQALQRCRRGELAALCDGARDLLDRVGDRYGVETRYADYDAMLGDGRVRAVLIAAPDPFHVPLAIRALDAGKHVLVEKPMGRTGAECLELVEAQRRTGLKLQVGSMMRHDPGVRFAHRFLREKAGPIFSVSAVYRDSTFRYDMQEACLDPLLVSDESIRPTDDPKADREHYNLTTQGAHLFDNIRHLAGDVASVTAQVERREGNRSWHGVLEFAAGGRGHFELTCKACGDVCHRYEVYGETGHATVSMMLPFYHRPARVRCFDGSTQHYAGPLGGHSNAYANQVDAFARSVLEDRPTDPDAVDGLGAVLLLEAVGRSVKTGGRVAVEKPAGCG